MMDSILGDDQLFLSLRMIIGKKVPGFQIRYKDESRIQKIIGFLAFFNPEYMTEYASVFFKKVYFPSKKYVEENPVQAFKILAHEYVHLLDKKKHPVLFRLLYAWPQFLCFLSLVSLVSLVHSQWWCVSMVALLALLPWPAQGRAKLELRGYTMNMAVNIWRHGSLREDTKVWIKEVFVGWAYYKMWPFKKEVDAWLDDSERMVYSIDSLQNKGVHLFNESEAYQDVYELLTGIEYD